MPTRLLSLLLLLLLAPAVWAKGVYLTAEQFIQGAFPHNQATPQVLWLTDDLRQQASKILHRPYRDLRVRYWQKGERTAWIFEEIGKELPITIGLVIDQQKIATVKILAFRESRGGEVKYPFFTDQFHGLELTEKQHLSQHIDGITGATMSVNAVKRASRLALLLNQHIAE